MPELRWTLLALGVLFIAALAWWELRKPRQARRDLDSRSPLLSGAREAENELPATQRVYREPTINLPEIKQARDTMPELPIIEIKDDTMIGLRVDGRRIEEDVQATASRPLEKPVVLPSEREPVSSRESFAPSDVEWEIDENDDRTVVWENSPEDMHSLIEPPPDVPVTPPKLVDEEIDKIETPEEGEITFEEKPALKIPEAVRVVSLDKPETPEPVVEWPAEEEQRQILSIRVVAGVNRFPGRAVRQALSADGFILGKLDIFHKAGDDGRAILSAASLTRPGTFSMDTMDMQRFGGLNLFAVLPGPLASHKTWDELLTSARTLNERLQGHLQDDTGQPLTPTRQAAIRANLPDIPAASAPSSSAPTTAVSAEPSESATAPEQNTEPPPT